MMDHLESVYENHVKPLSVADRSRLSKMMARDLATHPKGVPGKNLLVFAGQIPIADLRDMAQAIKADCEKVQTDEW